MQAKKLQIALEYMIIFAFVLVVFLFIFALVASQRAQTSSSQIYSQEQLIAQSVATQLDTALRAGNGYVARIPITGAIGTLAYQLLVTKNGGVIVNATVGNEALQAFAFSTARNVLSQSSYIQTNTFYYNLPIANGTLYIQNSFGTICVDYSCPNTSTQAANISLSSQLVHALPLNHTAGSYVALGTTGNNIAAQVTVSGWINPASPNGGYNYVFSNDRDCCGSYKGYDLRVASNKACFQIWDSGSINHGVCSAATIQANKWYFVAGTYDGSNVRVYLNGVLAGTLAFSGTIGTPASYNSAIGGLGLNPAQYDVNGMLANVQLYNISLSGTQITQLYSEGIAGTPLIPANTVGWWPLNGNANDYSGNGNTGTIHGPAFFPSVAQLFAKVTSPQGFVLGNTLVGFETSLGTFFSANQFATNFTNANGVATALFTQQSNSGQATVRVTAYNGNTALQGNLIGWWPLGLGQVNSTFDLSGSSNAGMLKGAAGWVNPNFVANLGGQSSYIYATNALTVTSAGTYDVISFWMYWSGKPNVVPFSFGSPSNYNLWINGASCLGFNTGNGDDYGINFLNYTNRWIFVTAEFYNGAYNKNSFLYINGANQSLTQCAGSAGSQTASNVLVVGDNSGLNSFYYNGSIANVQVYNGIMAASQITQLYNLGISATPYSTNLVAWLPLNGNANDYSGYNNNGTVYGNTNFVSSPTNESTGNNATSVLSARFNGIDSKVTGNLQSSLFPITATTWISVNAYAPNDIAEVAYFDNGKWQAFIQTSGYSQCKLGSLWWWNSSESMCTEFTVPLSTWTMLTYEANSTQMRACINAVCQSYYHSVNAPISGVLPFTIGGPGHKYFNGNITNFQVYNKTLSLQQLRQIYQQGVGGVPLSNSSLVAWWPLVGNANDYSGNGNNATATNVIYTASTVGLPATPSPFAGTGVEFNGQSSYVQLAQQPGWTSALTISAWANTYAPPTTGKSREVFNNNQLFLRLSGDANNHGYDCFLRLSDGTVEPRAASHFSPNVNTWNMVTCSWDGTTLSIYVNGVLKGTSTRSGTINSITEGPYVGATEQQNLPPNNEWNGSISDVQMYKTALTAQQIQQLYNSQAPPSASALIPVSWYP